jgi:uncharacterized protein (TIGR00369 family)
VTLPDIFPKSPFLQLIGGCMEGWGADGVRVRLPVEKRHTNPHGVLHGGVVTTLMDEAAGQVVTAARGVEETMAAPHATIEMNVSFLSGAREGDELVAEARVLKLGRTVAFSEAEVRRGSDGAIVAVGRFTFTVRRGA